MKNSIIKTTILIIGVCIIFMSHLSCTKKILDPSEHFKTYFLDPIPKSVTDIKVDQTKDFWGYGYVFGFNIEREDLNLIINSKALKKVSSFEYCKDGIISITYKPSDFSMPDIFIPIYYPWAKQEPIWFHPELWNNPETYVNIKDDTKPSYIQILIYNRETRQAYYYVDKSTN